MHAHTLLPRARGVSSFIGLVAKADVTALSPDTTSTESVAWPDRDVSAVASTGLDGQSPKESSGGERSNSNALQDAARQASLHESAGKQETGATQCEQDKVIRTAQNVQRAGFAHAVAGVGVGGSGGDDQQSDGGKRGLNQSEGM